MQGQVSIDATLNSLLPARSLTVQHLLMQAGEKAKREKFVLSVAYSPDGQRIACGCQDGTICVFECKTGQLLHSLEGHYKPVRSLTFTPGKLHS